VVLHRDYPGQECSAARALEVVGERWTLLIVRDVLLGVHRFDQLAETVGTTRAMLTRRLSALIADGIVEKRRYQTNPERFEYHATDKGRELFGVIAMLMQWGERHYGPGRVLVHNSCSQPIDPQLSCGCCGQPARLDDVSR
jgi:DNA-binding HxlR family transcriptional regulator